MDGAGLPVAGASAMQRLLSEERGLFSPLWVVNKSKGAVARKLEVGKDAAGADAAETQVRDKPSYTASWMWLYNACIGPAQACSVLYLLTMMIVWTCTPGACCCCAKRQCSSCCSGGV